MSRQNPDVLDKLYPSPERDAPENSPHQFQNVLELRDGRFAATTANKPVLETVNGHYSSLVSPNFPRGGVPPPQVSFLRQMLNSRRSQSVSPSSLVQLATRGGGVRVRRGGGRLLKGRLLGQSPAMVKLAGVGKTSQGSEVRDLLQQQQQQLNGLDQQTHNPCDKETVLSALRQRR